MDDMQNYPVVYTVKQVSQILHTNISFVYRMIAMGVLPAIKLGSLRVRKEALGEFLKKYEGYDLSDLQTIKPLACVI